MNNKYFLPLINILDSKLGRVRKCLLLLSKCDYKHFVHRPPIIILKNMSSCDSMYWKTIFYIQYFHTSNILDMGISAMPWRFFLWICLYLFVIVTHNNSHEKKWRFLRFYYIFFWKLPCILWVFSIKFKK